MRRSSRKAATASAAASASTTQDDLSILSEDMRRIIANGVRQPADIASLRQTASGNRTWPDSCDIASNITSECSAYDAKTFYMGSSDVASNKAALLQVLANESYELRVTNAENPCLNFDLQTWTHICQTPWFKCVFKPIRSIWAEEQLRGNMDPLCAMIKSGSLPNLNELWLGANQIDDAGMTAFAGAIASGSLASLIRLDLDQNQIGNDGMSAFAGAIASGSLGSLQTLDLRLNQIGDAGMTEFSRAIASGSLGKLEALGLGGNQIGDAGMSALAGAIASGSLPKLATLCIDSPSEQLKSVCSSKSIKLNRY